jgi:hypothetical protein
MKYLGCAFALASLLFSSGVYANDFAKLDHSACLPIVNACKAAGYGRHKEDKNFWLNCMKPILLGQSVKDVNVTSDQVKTCRKSKIHQLQNELKNLRDVQ